MGFLCRNLRVFDIPVHPIWVLGLTCLESRGPAAFPTVRFRRDHGDDPFSRILKTPLTDPQPAAG